MVGGGGGGGGEEEGERIKAVRNRVYPRVAADDNVYNKLSQGKVIPTWCVGLRFRPSI